MLNTLHRKKENMFNRVSPDKSLLKASKSSFELKTSSPKTSRLPEYNDENSEKNFSLFKKCALQGIRSSSFKLQN